MKYLLPPTGLAAPEPLVPSRAVRRGSGRLIVDFARLSGAGIGRLLQLLSEKPQPITALNTSWGELFWDGGAELTPKDGALLLHGEAGDGYGAPPHGPRIAVLDLAHPGIVDGLAGGLEDWLSWAGGSARTLIGADVFVAHSSDPRRPARRLMLPDLSARVDRDTIYEDSDDLDGFDDLDDYHDYFDDEDVDDDLVADWVAQARDGVLGDRVHAWPELGVSSRVARAVVAGPGSWPGWRVHQGIAGKAAVAQLAAEVHPLRAWSRRDYFSRLDEPAGVSLAGHVVETYTVGANNLPPDGIGVTLAPRNAVRLDNAETVHLGFLPPAHVLAGRTDAMVSLLVESYTSLRWDGVTPAAAAEAVVAATY